MTDWRDTLPADLRRSFADNIADESRAWLELAVNQGIVDVRLHPFDDDNFPIEIFGMVEDWAEDVQATYPTPDLYVEAKSRKIQESMLTPVLHVTPTTTRMVCEVARIIVPQGHIGFLQNIEQTLHDAAGNYYATSNQYWGSPYSVDPDVAGCRWYLTTQHFDSFDGAQFNNQALAAFDPYRDLPGSPYSEKFEINGIWYPAHAPTSKIDNWLIPQQTVLRLFFYTPPTSNFQWVAGGRLRAVTQSTFSEEAAHNARSTNA
jgi:hypothetical protein